MRVSILLAVLLTLVGCAPAFEPVPGDPPGVTLTSAHNAGDLFTVFTLTTENPVDRSFLRFIGLDLTENADECRVEAGAVECITGSFNEVFEVSIGGAVMNDPSLPYGIACLEQGCFEVFLE